MKPSTSKGTTPSGTDTSGTANAASRAAIASSAAAFLEARASIGFAPALIGFDGFVDYILRMVDVRSGMGPAEFTPFHTIAAFAARCAAAAGKSTNIEQVLVEERFGGNGPLMAGALGSLAVPVTYIGAIAEREGDAAVHPVFRGFAARCAKVHAICEPSFTDALEFDDGKLMFNNTGAVQRVTWERIVECVGIDALVHAVNASTLLGVVNWSLLGGVPGIWRGVMRDVLPRCERRTRHMFVDLADPAKRTDADVRGVIELLGEIEASDLGVRVTLGLNLSEAQRIGRVLGLETSAWSAGPSLQAAASAILVAARLDCVTIHPREGAAAAEAVRDGGSGAGAFRSAWIDGPLVAQPRISTGAGDHYNAGFALARAHGAELAQSLACGVATSGVYVRDGESPSLARLVAFLRELPMPAMGEA